MRTVSGAILLAASEQAFAHSQMIGFPNQLVAKQVLFPAALVFGVLGTVLVLWGVLTDHRVGRSVDRAASGNNSAEST